MKSAGPAVRVFPVVHVTVTSVDDACVDGFVLYTLKLLIQQVLLLGLASILFLMVDVFFFNFL